MRTRSHAVLVVVLSGGVGCLLVSGCAQDDPASSASTGTGADALPPSGVWVYTDGGVQENTCGTNDLYRDPDTQFVLTQNGDGTFTIDQGAAQSFTCMVDGPEFDCPERLSSEEPVDMIDAVITWSVSITGTFSSDTHMSGTQRADVTCGGTQCDLAALGGVTLPCYYTVAFTADAE